MRNLNDSLAGQKDQLNSIKAQMEDMQSDWMRFTRPSN